MRRTTLTFLVMVLAFGGVLRADDYHEGVDGDLSGDRFSPTSIGLDAGPNTITATSVSGDREYYTITVPAGHELSSITLADYVSLDPIAFIAVQNGTTFTEPPTGTDVTQLLGWTHFGPTLLGTDIQDDIGAGSGAMGFTGSLAPGDYTFWSQQTGLNPATYVLVYQVDEVAGVPALSGVAMLLLCLMLGSLLVVLQRRKLAGARPKD